jgi:hypothetical protein
MQRPTSPDSDEVWLPLERDAGADDIGIRRDVRMSNRRLDAVIVLVYNPCSLERSMQMIDVGNSGSDAPLPCDDRGNSLG